MHIDACISVVYSWHISDSAWLRCTDTAYRCLHWTDYSWHISDSAWLHCNGTAYRRCIQSTAHVSLLFSYVLCNISDPVCLSCTGIAYLSSRLFIYSCHFRIQSGFNVLDLPINACSSLIYSCVVFQIKPDIIVLGLPIDAHVLPAWFHFTGTAYRRWHFVNPFQCCISDSAWLPCTGPAYRCSHFVHIFLCPTSDLACISGTGSDYQCSHFVHLFPALYFR
jgi:hypothetical protein